MADVGEPAGVAAEACHFAVNADLGEDAAGVAKDGLEAAVGRREDGGIGEYWELGPPGEGEAERAVGCVRKAE